MVEIPVLSSAYRAIKQEMEGKEPPKEFIEAQARPSHYKLETEVTPANYNVSNTPNPISPNMVNTETVITGFGKKITATRSPYGDRAPVVTLMPAGEMSIEDMRKDIARKKELLKVRGEEVVLSKEQQRLNQEYGEIVKKRYYELNPEKKTRGMKVAEAYHGTTGFIVGVSKKISPVVQGVTSSYIGATGGMRQKVSAAHYWGMKKQPRQALYVAEGEGKQVWREARAAARQIEDNTGRRTTVGQIAPGRVAVFYQAASGRHRSNWHSGPAPMFQRRHGTHSIRATSVMPMRSVSSPIGFGRATHPAASSSLTRINIMGANSDIHRSSASRMGDYQREIPGGVGTPIKRKNGFGAWF
jgi:hypothetical protein